MLNLAVPKPVEDKLEALCALVEKHPDYLPLPEVAAFLGANAEGLRASIEQGRAPFGISWQKTARGNKAFKIPSTRFFLWYTGLNPFDRREENDR
jgi:hypothetical protein